MKSLHPFWLIVIGWLIAVVIPPTMLMAMFKGKSAG